MASWGVFQTENLVDNFVIVPLESVLQQGQRRPAKYAAISLTQGRLFQIDIWNQLFGVGGCGTRFGAPPAELLDDHFAVPLSLFSS